MASFGAPEVKDSIAQLGLTVSEVGGGVLWATRDDPMGGFLCRAVGQGLREPITADVLDEVAEAARAAGAPFVAVQPSTELVTPSLEELLSDRGFAAEPELGQALPGRVAAAGSRDRLARRGARRRAGDGVRRRDARRLRDARGGAPVRRGRDRPARLDSRGAGRRHGRGGRGDVRRREHRVPVGAATLPPTEAVALSALSCRRGSRRRPRPVTLLGTETWSDTTTRRPEPDNMHWAGFRTLYQRRNYVRMLRLRRPRSRRPLHGGAGRRPCAQWQRPERLPGRARSRPRRPIWPSRSTSCLVQRTKSPGARGSASRSTASSGWPDAHR